MDRLSRRHTIPVRIGNVVIGGDAPIVVQSMTNTDTADIEATTAQVAALARAGSELVRITVATARKQPPRYPISASGWIVSASKRR